MALTADTPSSFLTVVVDHDEPQIYSVPKGDSELLLAKGLDEGPHTAEFVKRTETWEGTLTFTGLRLSTTGALLNAPALSQRKLLFIGDSVTCGAGDQISDVPDGARPQLERL